MTDYHHCSHTGSMDRRTTAARGHVPLHFSSEGHTVLFTPFIIFVREYFTVDRAQKTVQNCFCHKFVKCLPNLTFFGKQIAQRIGICLC